MKSFATYFLPTAALVILVTLGVGLALNRAELDKLKVHESSYLKSGTNILLSALDTPLNHLRGLVKEAAIQQALQAPLPAARSLMEEHLQTLVTRNPLYDQARWLSAAGMELARVNRTAEDAVIVPTADLQDKSARYYYQAAIRLAPGQLYVSPLDLNIERDLVEVPYKPMIRVAIRLPVVAGRDQGLLLINYLAQSLLDQLRRLAPPGHEGHPMLLNPQGYWLLAPDPADAWGFMFGRDLSLGQRHPLEWARIGADAEGQLQTASGLWHWTTIDLTRHQPGIIQASEVWKLVTWVSAAELWQLQWDHWRSLALVAASALLLLALAVYFYRKLLREKEQSESALARVRARQAAEEDQRRTEQRWKLALDGAGHGIWDWRLATDTVDFSPGWKTMLGYADEEIGHDLTEWSSRVHPDDLPRVLAAVQAHLAGATASYESVHRVRCKDGHWLWVLDRGRVLERDASAQPVRMVGTHTDISTQRETEARLLRSEEHLRLATEGADLGVWYWDMATQTLNWSERSKVHLGLPPGEEPNFDNFYRAMHPDDRPRVEALIAQAVAERSEYAAEYRVRWTDGSEHWISAPGRVYTHPDGSLRGMGGITQDITARRLAEAEVCAINASLEERVAERTAELVTAQSDLQSALSRVEQSEARLRTMFAEAPLGIALVDSLTGRIYELNDRFAAITGRSREEMMASDWMRITHPDDLEADLDNMARLNAGEIPGFQMNKRFLRPDGSVVWISMTIAPVTLKPGESRRHLAMIDDITERVRLETELRVAKDAAEAATLAKSEFLAHMSHEIRTPMNAVLGLAQLLGRERLSDHQAVMVARILGAGQSLLGIINDILDFSKIEAGQLRLEVRPFDLGTLTLKLAGLLGPTAQAKGLALRVSPAPNGLGPLQGDALRLEQVLVNLLGNAIKFTTSGEVSLTVTALDPTPPGIAEPAVTTLDSAPIDTASPTGTAKPAGRRLRFEVRDTGIGMSPAALAGLFQPFTQADAGITRRFGGTGLGLSISQRLVEMMGGRIQVTSTEGQGSTFAFELTFAPAAPLEAATPNALAALAAPASDPAAGPRLTGLHLLAVDDSPMNRDLVERALTLEGAQVVLAADGQQAVQLLQAPSQAYDAVLMDVQMPVMDGRTATRLIRDRLGLKELPVIALTAGVLAGEQRAIRDAGANEVLAKPLDLEQLVATLLRLIPAPARQAAVARAVPLGQQSAQGQERRDDFPPIAGVIPHANPRFTAPYW